MVCIYCLNKLKTTNSRHLKRVNGVWRRKKCLNCQATFTTVELNDYEQSLLVNSKNKTSPFSRDTLFVSILNSLKHRKNSIIEASELTNTVINKMQHSLVNASIDTDTLRKISFNTLEQFDFVASIQYKAFYMDNK